MPSPLHGRPPGWAAGRGAAGRSTSTDGIAAQTHPSPCTWPCYPWAEVLERRVLASGAEGWPEGGPAAGAGPLPPSLVDLASGSDTGRLDNDNLTNCLQPEITIRTDDPTTQGVRVYCGGQLAGEASGGGGIWTLILPPGRLAEGANVITARSWNGSGQSDSSPSLVVILDTVAPLAGPGSVDSAFGTGGKVVTPAGDHDDYAYAVAIQGDGKIVVAGSANVGGSVDIAVVRYNADGALDGEFGTGGKVLTPVGPYDDEAGAVAIQNDGKIVVAGWSRQAGGSYEFVVVRYDTDGSLDGTFGTAGKVTTPLGSHAGATCVGIQDDGKIVAAGHGEVGGYSHFAMVRYNDDGSLDDGFGDGGKVIAPVGTYYDFCFSLAMQDDGRIVLGGEARMSATEREDFALARYNDDGTLDGSFGTGGKVITSLGPGSDRVYSLAIQADGKIIAAGCADLDYLALVRYDASGALDGGFGTGGKVIPPADPQRPDRGRSVAIQADGKIVVAGTSSTSFGVSRYHADGTLDGTFGAAGKAAMQVGLYGDWVNSMAIQTDGRIVVAGAACCDAGIDFGLVRFNAEDGSALDLDAGSDTGMDPADRITSDATPTLKVSWGPYFRVYQDGQLLSGPYESGGSFTTPALPDGTYAFRMGLVDEAGNESSPPEELVVAIDTAPPRLADLDVRQEDGDLLLSFSEPVALEKGHLALFGPSGEPFDLAGAVLDHPIGSGTATLHLAERPQPGWYRLVIQGMGGPADIAGNAFDGDGDGAGGDDGMAQFVIALAGDANADGEVGRPDLLAVKAHLGQAHCGWAGGDFNGNGVVDVLDYVALKVNYGRVLSPPEPLPAGPAEMPVGSDAGAGQEAPAGSPPAEAVLACDGASAGAVAPSDTTAPLGSVGEPSYMEAPTGGPEMGTYAAPAAAVLLGEGGMALPALRTALRRRIPQNGSACVPPARPMRSRLGRVDVPAPARSVLRLDPATRRFPSAEVPPRPCQLGEMEAETFPPAAWPFGDVLDPLAMSRRLPALP